MKEIHSGNNEAPDSVCECDSDVEDDEVSESTPEDKPVQVRRSARRLSPFRKCTDAGLTSLRESSTAFFGVLNLGAWKT